MARDVPAVLAVGARRGNQAAQVPEVHGEACLALDRDRRRTGLDDEVDLRPRRRAVWYIARLAC